MVETAGHHGKAGGAGTCPRQDLGRPSGPAELPEIGVEAHLGAKTRGYGCYKVAVLPEKGEGVGPVLEQGYHGKIEPHQPQGREEPCPGGKEELLHRERASGMVLLVLIQGQFPQGGAVPSEGPLRDPSHIPHHQLQP